MKINKMFTCRKQEEAFDEIEKVFSSFGNYPIIDYGNVEFVPSTRRIVICTENKEPELEKKIKEEWEGKEIETNTYKGSVNYEIKEKKLKIYLPDFHIGLNDPLKDIEGNDVIHIVFRRIDLQLFSENFWFLPLTNYTIFITNDELFKEGRFATIMDCLTREVNLNYNNTLYHSRDKTYEYGKVEPYHKNIISRDDFRRPFNEKSFI